MAPEVVELWKLLWTQTAPPTHRIARTHTISSHAYLLLFVEDFTRIPDREQGNKIAFLSWISKKIKDKKIYTLNQIKNIVYVTTSNLLLKIMGGLSEFLISYLE